MSAHVLVVNCGSSSIKYQLVNVDSGAAAAKGLVERIGEANSLLAHSTDAATHEVEAPLADHEAGLRAVLDAFATHGPSLTDSDVVAIGHRVVHGGPRFSAPAVVTDEVEAAIADLIPLAPLHNPANLEGIRVARRVFPDLPSVAVFDTAFHSTLPEHAYRYAIDREVADRLSIRRYGFHGTSHAFVARQTAETLGRPVESLNTIVLHLGNGASASAVAGGRCIDTSMGLTPLEGLVMGTRSGDLDPAVVFHLARVGGMSLDQIDTLLNKASGMIGLTGQNDLRQVWATTESDDTAAADAARTALELYAYRIRKYIGAYAAALGRVDAIAFTAGVGENDYRVRALALQGLDTLLGVELDASRNAVRRPDPRVISTDTSRVAVLVVPTNEELEIARQAVAVTAGRAS